MPAKTNVDEIVANAHRIQSPPKILASFLHTLASPSCRWSDLRSVVETDVAISASILRVANSAAFRPAAGKTTSLAGAMSLLGEDRVVQIVLACAAECLRAPKIPGYCLGSGEMWRSAVATAVASEQIAHHISLDSGLAYAAGLLLDVGKLALGAFLPDEAAASARSAQTNSDTDSETANEPFDAWERGILGIDHAELGGRIAEHWNLPSPMVTALRYHHRPHEAPEHKQLVFTVHLASSIATMLFATGVDAFRYTVAGWSEHLPIDPNNVDELVVTIHAHLSEAEKLFSEIIS